MCRTEFLFPACMFACVHLFEKTEKKQQKKKVLKKQKKLRQMRDTKIHPEIHEPVQEPLGGSDLGGIVIESASTPQTSTQHEPENSHSAAFEQPLKEVNSLTDRSWK